MASAAASVDMEVSWKEVLQEEFSKPYFDAIREYLKAERQKGHVFYPPGKLIFNAYNLTPFHEVKVVLLGQDPYHGPGQAHGLCFSVPDGVQSPPSLQNIFKELKNDLHIPVPQKGNLTGWAEQGVFLLNAILTVQANRPASHQQIGWQHFTDATIRALSLRREGLVFMLWGNYARQKSALIDSARHLVLMAPHPSPFSADRGFFGCGHFSKANRWLEEHDMQAVRWNLS